MKETELLIFLVYILPFKQIAKKNLIQIILNEIQTTITEASTKNKTIQVILTKDFNRYHLA